jgi:diadenosine tetraphosphate (Ap4A) HIT family hydrolase
MKQECIFCKIVKGEIDSAKIWEDDEFLAILDIMPNTKGMTLVLTKKHYDSYAFDMPEDVYLRFMSASKKVARILEKGLDVARVAMVMEGMGINHAHIKLYPLHGVKEKFKEMWTKEKVFFDKYEGYISTQTGPKIDINKLKKLAEEIKNKI